MIKIKKNTIFTPAIFLHTQTRTLPNTHIRIADLNIRVRSDLSPK